MRDCGPGGGSRDQRGTGTGVACSQCPEPRGDGGLAGICRRGLRAARELARLLRSPPREPDVIAVGSPLQRQLPERRGLNRPGDAICHSLTPRVPMPVRWLPAFQACWCKTGLSSCWRFRRGLETCEDWVNRYRLAARGQLLGHSGSGRIAPRRVAHTASCSDRSMASRGNLRLRRDQAT